MTKVQQQHLEALERRSHWLGILLDYCSGYAEEISAEDLQWAQSRAKRMLSNTVNQIIRFKEKHENDLL